MSKQLLCVVYLCALSIFLPLDLMAESMNYSTLQMMDFKEMESKVSHLLKESMQYRKDEDEENAVSSLVKASQLIFSRPDRDDNMVSKLFREVRPKLKDLDAYESSLKAIAKNAIETIKNDKEKAAVRATQIYLLENMMAELKPELKNNPKVKPIFILIRDAKIEIPKAVKNHFLLKGTANRKSPSAVAGQIIGK